MNNKKFKVFIQSNKKQELGALLSRYSLIKNSQNSSLFDVEIMMVENQPDLMEMNGREYLRNGEIFKFDREDLQSFTLSRFLPPDLMNFEGRALVIDPDVFAIEGVDIFELLNMEMSSHSILACPAGEGVFKSSVMLLDCSKLRHWKWNALLNDLFEKRIDYRRLMQLSLEPEKSVGLLGEEWNHCDVLNSQTKLIHFTRRLTQPWKTGLKVDFTYDGNQGFLARQRRKIVTPVKILLGREKKFFSKYQPNPDPVQEMFFFRLAKQALKENVLSVDFIKYNLNQNFIRPDFLKKIEQVS